MARSLANKVNVQAPDTDYPYGRIKDNDGTGNGTPVNENVYGDVHQFFERLMALAGVSHNELPDNDYTGFQFVEALIQFIKDTVLSDVAVISNESGIKTKVKKVDIGIWDMDTTASVTITFAEHGIPPGKITSVDVLIYDDNAIADTSNKLRAPLSAGAGYLGGDSGFWYLEEAAGNDQIVLTRIAAGDFDSTAFDNSTDNRGFVFIEYED